MDGSIYELLKQYDVSVVSHVPDAGHTALIERCEADAAMRTVTLTTEEEGIALAAGAWLGGAARVAADAVERRRQLHQHARRCRACRFPLADAGHDARRVGRVQPVAGADGPGHRRRCSRPCGVIVHRADRAGRASRRRSRPRCALAFAVRAAVAVLLSQRLHRRQELRRGDRPHERCSTAAPSSASSSRPRRAARRRRPRRDRLGRRRRRRLRRSTSRSGARWAAPR